MNVLSGERPLSQGRGIKICTIKLFHIIFDRGGVKCLLEPSTSRRGLLKIISLQFAITFFDNNNNNTMRYRGTGWQFIKEKVINLFPIIQDFFELT